MLNRKQLYSRNPQRLIVVIAYLDAQRACAGLGKIDGQPIVGSGDLPAFVGQALPGQKVTLEIWRNGEARTLNAVLGDASDKAAKVAKDKPDAGKGKLGLALRPLQPEEKQQIGVKRKV